MNRLFRSILVSVMLACSAFAVQASTYSFDFTSNDATYAMDGYMVVDDAQNALGSYNILSITGEIFGPGGGTITGLIKNPNRPNPTEDYGFMYDNVFSLNVYGVLFKVGTGATWNLYQEGTGYHLFTYNADGPNGVVDSFGVFSAMPVPEPETYAMMLAGLALLLGLASRRRRQ